MILLKAWGSVEFYMAAYFCAYLLPPLCDVFLGVGGVHPISCDRKEHGWSLLRTPRGSGMTPLAYKYTLNPAG